MGSFRKTGDEGGKWVRLVRGGMAAPHGRGFGRIGGSVAIMGSFRNGPCPADEGPPGDEVAGLHGSAHWMGLERGEAQCIQGSFAVAISGNRSMRAWGSLVHSSCRLSLSGRTLPDWVVIGKVPWGVLGIGETVPPELYGIMSHLISLL